MPVRLARPESDLSRIAAVVNAVEPEPVSVATVNQWFDSSQPGRIVQRTVVTNEHDDVVGYGVALHEPWWPAGQFYLWVGVDPLWRRHGYGRALYADAESFLLQHNAMQVTSEVRDDDPVALQFAHLHGFTSAGHVFASTVDVTTFDATPYASIMATLEAAGIRFFSMADVPDTLATRRALYSLNQHTSLDIPGATGSDMSVADFEAQVCGAAWYRPDGQLIAADGDTWVGLAAVRLLPETQSAYNLMTGVLRPYRGRSIALALKVRAMRYARVHEARSMSTHNDSRNAPMLALNRKLGYQPQPGTYLLRRERT